MAPLRLPRSICFALILSILPCQTMAQGKLALYTSAYCEVASTMLPTVELPLSTCLVPIGALSIYVDQVPACDNGSASQMIMYEDTSCSEESYPSTNTYSGMQDDQSKPCYYMYLSNSVPSVMFTCDDPSTHPQASTTTTVTASLQAAVATGITGNIPTTTQHSSGSTTTTASNSGSSGTSSSSTSITSSNTSSPSGLSMSDKIAIGVGVGVGAPSILIAFAAWCWPRHRF